MGVRVVADLDDSEVAGHGFELSRVVAVGDNPGDVGAFRAVLEVCFAKHGGGWVKDETCFDARQHGFPQFHLVIEHEHDPVAALYSYFRQPVGEL